jgi:hypothetical protein
VKTVYLTQAPRDLGWTTGPAWLSWLQSQGDCQIAYAIADATPHEKARLEILEQASVDDFGPELIVVEGPIGTLDNQRVSPEWLDRQARQGCTVLMLNQNQSGCLEGYRS